MNNHQIGRESENIHYKQTQDLDTTQYIEVAVSKLGCWPSIGWVDDGESGGSRYSHRHFILRTVTGLCRNVDKSRLVVSEEWCAEYEDGLTCSSLTGNFFHGQGGCSSRLEDNWWRDDWSWPQQESGSSWAGRKFGPWELYPSNLFSFLSVAPTLLTSLSNEIGWDSHRLLQKILIYLWSIIRLSLSSMHWPGHWMATSQSWALN